LKISQGIANKSFQRSRAKLAVIKLQDFFCASITNVQTEIPATISFLIGKLYGFPTSQTGKIEITHQSFFTISS
jgi:isochorismate hydrolase